MENRYAVLGTNCTASTTEMAFPFVMRQQQILPFHDEPTGIMEPLRGYIIYTLFETGPPKDNVFDIVTS